MTPAARLPSHGRVGKHRAAAELRRDAEFEAFAAGAAGRLLHTALLLTGDQAEAERLLTTALSRTYADWFRMRAEDPYERARGELVRRFACRPWWRRPHGGTLDRLTGQERLVVTMRFFEGVAEEQTAAQLGLPAERVRAICARAAATLRSRDAGVGGAGSPAGASRLPGAGPSAGSGPTGTPGSGRSASPGPSAGSGASAFSADTGPSGAPRSAPSAASGVPPSGVPRAAPRAASGRIAGKRPGARRAAGEPSGSHVPEVSP